MRRFRLHRPTPALVVAFAALLVSLGGTGLAAFVLPPNSVGARNLRRGAVTTSKLAAGAVTKDKFNPAGVTVPNALRANSAATATDATNATNATDAVNAVSAGVATDARHATNADHATSAGDATTLQGQTVAHFFMKGPANTTPTTQLDVDGIVIKAGCDGSGNPIATIENDSGVAAALELVVFPGSSETGTYTNLASTPFDLTQGHIIAVGQFDVARTDGAVVTGQYMFRAPPVFSGESVCTVNGSVIAS